MEENRGTVTGYGHIGSQDDTQRLKRTMAETVKSRFCIISVSQSTFLLVLQ